MAGGWGILAAGVMGIAEGLYDVRTGQKSAEYLAAKGVSETASAGVGLVTQVGTAGLPWYGKLGVKAFFMPSLKSVQWSIEATVE